MKTILLSMMLMQLVIQMPEKNVSSINWTLDGFDVVNVESILQDGKELDWNRLSDKQTKFIVYGGKKVLTNDDKVIVYGYQTLSSVKIKDCVGASPIAEQIDIYNRYRRIYETAC